jgi:hypothetical protein
VLIPLCLPFPQGNVGVYQKVIKGRSFLDSSWCQDFQPTDENILVDPGILGVIMMILSYICFYEHIL